jgi:hypothetical protein
MYQEESHTFRRLIVLQHAGSPLEGEFTHALDWASRLSLPTVIVSPQADALDTCKEMCANRAIPCQVLYWADKTLAGLDRLLAPTDLCVVRRGLPAVLKKHILERTSGDAATAILIRSEREEFPSRVLIVHTCALSDGQYLALAVQLCKELGCRPVILTLAKSERAARSLQQAALGQLTGMEVSCDFDFLVGVESLAAVASVARWRDCQLVIMGHDAAPAWRRWLRGDSMQQMLEGFESLDTLVIANVSEHKVRTPAYQGRAMPRSL